MFRSDAAVYFHIASIWSTNLNKEFPPRKHFTSPALQIITYVYISCSVTQCETVARFFCLLSLEDAQMSPIHCVQVNMKASFGALVKM